MSVTIHVTITTKGCFDEFHALAKELHLRGSKGCISIHLFIQSHEHPKFAEVWKARAILTLTLQKSGAKWRRFWTLIGRLP